MYLVLGLLLALAIAGPLLGADTRDGLDWTPGDFWLRRRVPGRDHPRRSGVERPGKNARTSVPPVMGDGRRTAQVDQTTRCAA